MGGVASGIGNVVGSLLGTKQATDAQLKAQREASAQAEARAQQQAELQRQELNKANAKTPDMGSLLDRAQAASKLGAQGTILTGNQGVDEDSLLLGKKSLLGS